MHSIVKIHEELWPVEHVHRHTQRQNFCKTTSLRLPYGDVKIKNNNNNKDMHCFLEVRYWYMELLAQIIAGWKKSAEIWNLPVVWNWIINGKMCTYSKSLELSIHYFKIQIYLVTMTTIETTRSSIVAVLNVTNIYLIYRYIFRELSSEIVRPWSVTEKSSEPNAW